MSASLWDYEIIHKNPQTALLINGIVPDFLPTLPTRLAQFPCDAALPSELQSHITSLQVSANAIAAISRKEDLDGKATELWNLATRMSRQDQKVLARVSNNETSDGQHRAGRDTDLLAMAWKVSIRLMKVALKAAKSCLDGVHLDLCTKVMEKAADYKAAMYQMGQMTNHQDKCEDSNEENNVYGKLRLEYWALRITLAWKQERLDLAENMYRYFKQDEIEGNDGAQVQDSETIADLLFEIGKDMFRKRDYHEAVKWLERSLDTFSVHDLTSMSTNSGELKSSVINYLVRSLVAQKDGEGRVRADNLIVLLESDYGDKLFVALLRLEYLAAEPSFHSERYYTVLVRIIRIVHLTDINFKTIMKHVHLLKEQSAIHACKALDDLLTLRLLGDSKESWIENAFITRLWLSTDNMADAENDLGALQSIMAGLTAKFIKPLTAAGIHASQVLIWKRVNFEYDRGEYNSAQAWTRLSTNQLLADVGDLNAARISRKLIMCALAKQDLVEARSIFNQMSNEARDLPMTRYLMYKAALQDQDSILAAECLDLVSRDTTKGSTLLYACVLEAQQCGNKDQAIKALQLVVAKFNYPTPNGVHLPALLRCTARLLVSELLVNGVCPDDITTQICDLFNGAMFAAEKFLSMKNSTSEVFNETEMKWFARNSYNLAVKYYGEWQHEDSVKLLGACIFFVEKSSSFCLSSGRETMASQYRISLVLITQSLIKLARISESHELQLQYYLRARKYVQQHNAQETSYQSRIEKSKEIDETAQRMVKNDFEAAIHLKAWDDLSRIINDSRVYQDQQLYEVLADMLLACEAPSAIMISSLESLITTSSSLNRPTISKLARWLRIGYTLSLQYDAASNTLIESHTVSSSSKTELILSHALKIARSSFAEPGTNRGPKPETYPSEELEYLATTTFNRAIDAFCAGDEDECCRLGERALEIAGVLSNLDHGELRQCMVERLKSLRGEL